MRKYISALLFISLLLINCKKDDGLDVIVDESSDVILEDDIVEDSLDVTEEQISHTTIDLVWEPISADNDVDVSYDIMLNGELIKEKNTDTDFTLTGLNGGTTYEGEIIAREDSSTSKKNIFDSQISKKGDIIETIPFKVTTTAFDAPDAPSPSDFNVNVTNIGQTEIDLTWDTSTITDGSTITYTVYLEGDKIAESLSNTDYSISSLSVATEYHGQVVAISTNQKTFTTNFSFTTEKLLKPGDFTINVSDITDESAVLTWNRPSVTNNSQLSYTIFLSNQQVVTELTGDATLSYTLEDLTPSSSYSGSIEAVNTDTGLTKTINFTFETIEYSSIPSDFTINVSDITTGSAVFSWTKPNVSNNSPLSYSIYIFDNEYASAITTLSHTITSPVITPATSFIGYIEALNTDSGLVKQTYFTFDTPTLDATTPEKFTVETNDVTTDTMVLTWDRPNVTDNAQLIYSIAISGIEVYTLTNDDVNLSVPLDDLNLEASTSYTGSIEARNADTDATRIEGFSFETPDN